MDHENLNFPYNYRDKMKEKALNDFNFITYSDYFMNALLTKFEYRNFPDTFNSVFFELYMRTEGSAIAGYPTKITKSAENYDPNVFTAAPGFLTGALDNNGLGIMARGVFPNGEIMGKRGVEVAYCRNNPIASPDLFVRYYSALLSEIQSSIRAAIVYTRHIPIPLVRDGKIKAVIQGAINNLKNGKIEAVCNDSAMKDFNGAYQSIELLNLSDPTLADKMQYLFKAIDDTMRQFWILNGQCTQGTGKMAQQSEKEIDGMTSIAYIDTYCEEVERKKFEKQCRDIWGMDCEIVLSEPWKIELEKYKEGLPLDDQKQLEEETEIAIEEAEEAAKEEPEEKEEASDEEKEND